MAVFSASGTKGRLLQPWVVAATLLSLPGLTVFAQSQDADDDEVAVDEIVVIGTHIRQVDPDVHRL